MDNTKHKKYTGVTNELILSNLQELAKIDVDIYIRIPLIKKVNDDYENISKSAKFISELERRPKMVNILLNTNLYLHII